MNVGGNTSLQVENNHDGMFTWITEQTAQKNWKKKHLKHLQNCADNLQKQRKFDWKTEAELNFHSDCSENMYYWCWTYKIACEMFGK